MVDPGSIANQFPELGPVSVPIDHPIDRKSKTLERTALAT
jgi:hypothetical protein